MIIITIIIMEICKAPTLRFKALNKHTHIMYIEIENVLKKEEEEEMYISTNVQQLAFILTWSAGVCTLIVWPSY